MAPRPRLADASPLALGLRYSASIDRLSSRGVAAHGAGTRATEPIQAGTYA